MKNTLLSLIALVALPLASFAGQPTTSTPTVGFGGTAIPGGSQSTSYVITKPGAYYLAGDRSMTADVSAIVVNVPDVTIDLNGCTISFTGGSAANGVEIPSTSNVEIRNGSIGDVPNHAISSVGGTGLRVIDVRVTTAGKNGIYSTTGLTTVDRCDFSFCGGFGVYVLSAYSPRVSNTHVANCGLSGITLSAAYYGEVSNCHAAYNHRSGISLVNSTGCIARDNVVSKNNEDKIAADGGIVLGAGCTARGNTITFNCFNGIYVNGNGSIIDGNDIRFSANSVDNTALGNAINVGAGGALYLNNHISPSTNMLVGSLVNGGGNVLY